MAGKKIPDWFFDLFHDLVIKHGLSPDIWEYHLERAKEIYMKMSEEIDSGTDDNWDKESVTVESLKNWNIGQLHLDEDDEIMRMGNGSQFLFLSEFYRELHRALSNDKNNEAEHLPQYQYETEAQKIAWLNALGVIDTILQQCKNGDTIVWRQAANIISSFTGINPETVRKCVMAIHQPGSDNDKNNPLNNRENRLFVLQMLEKFKLRKN